MKFGFARIPLVFTTSFVLLLFTTSVPALGATSVKNGDRCNPAGAVFKQGQTTFVCKKVGSKVMWKAKVAPDVPKDSFKMPRVVGMNLQLAQDLLQSLGSYIMDQTDAAGLSRWQIFDGNWKVCAQSPPAGRIVPQSITVTLASVKLEERCP
ncbi:MAG TPA: PASTA domain-containing protein [Candidatus Nanopelagicaceae bacterium]|jgi:hypothetical protein